MGDTASPSEGPSPAILPLLRELGDLKRIRSAGREGSIATRLFVAGWAALVRGDAPDAVMRRTVAAALAAARLGDLDQATLLRLGVDPGPVLERAFAEVAGELDADLAATLYPALAEGAPASGPVPAFVTLLAEQPRAGVTCPGRPRIMLQPAENHAEHCLVVAVYAVLLSPAYGADPVAAFSAGMAHHLHSAAMPDAGYSGEVLLDEALDGAIAAAREAALSELAPPFARWAKRAVMPIADDRSPEARAFHAADVIDRVLEIEQHLAARAVTMNRVLDEYGLVHDGPVKPFHDDVLRRMGLP